MIHLVPEEKMRQMLKTFAAGEDDLAEDLIRFADRVQHELVRRNDLLTRRNTCSMRGQHRFRLKGNAGFGQIEYDGSDLTTVGWKGTGECDTCDAVLGVSYTEDLG